MVATLRLVALAAVLEPVGDLGRAQLGLLRQFSLVGRSGVPVTLRHKRTHAVMAVMAGGMPV